ncbi:MAG: hypothetical protein D6B27_09990 [Gammaproteobacteria bacterium]|nr:MAG: hypothetical protein D6B27_09990 [Gammaproteobacteria bacterium]
MRALLLFLIIANLGFAGWQFHTQGQDKNIKFTRKVNKGNLKLLEEVPSMKKQLMAKMQIEKENEPGNNDKVNNN